MDDEYDYLIGLSFWYANLTGRRCFDKRVGSLTPEELGDRLARVQYSSRYVSDERIMQIFDG